MAKLGFIGLGIMGLPMAQNLLKAGHQVAVWSHTEEKARQISATPGGVFCKTPAEVARQSECVFLIVGDTAMSSEVILGKDGLAAGGARGLVIVDCSTVSPDESKRIAKELDARGMHFLDAPCTGSKPGAEKGTLTFMIGGDKDVFERVRPYFEPMGKSLYYCGKQGAGLHAKLTQNLILGNLLQAFNEGLVLSTKAGIDPDLMLEILENSAAKSGFIAFKAPFVFRRDFSTNFSMRWLAKDMSLMVESGESLGVPLALTALSEQMLRAGIAKGYGDEDICGSIRLLEGIAGVEVKSKKAATEPAAASKK
ncbi:MAG: NAD(P)-dependent oxidoreductase [Candidatus Korobacteraceae bacterium]